MAFAGMWIVVRRNASAIVMPDDIFRDFCQPMSSAAETVWNENPGKGLHPVIPYAWDQEPS